MLEKTKDIIDILLCSFYMAMFCVVPIFLLTGFLRGIGIAALFFGFVVAIISGALSGAAVFSDRMAKAGIKWAVSVPFSIGIFCFLVNTQFILRIERAMNAADYSNGDGLGVMLLFVSILAVVGIGELIGVSYSGKQLSREMENAFATLKKVLCPVSCAVMVALVVLLVCILPPPLPPAYG